jgi:O-antigen/teichoic acid export membrane protein
MRRNTAFAFAVQVATTACTFVLTVVLVRALGADRYGTFSVALAVGGLVLLPADFGISASAARFLAEAVNDPRLRRATLITAFRLKLAASVIASAGLATIAGPIAALYGEPGLVWPLRGVALAIAGQGMMRFAVSACASQQRSALSFAIVTAESLTETVASIALVVAGGGAAGAAFGRAIGYAVGASVGVVAILRLFGLTPKALLGERNECSLGRRIARYAGAIALVDSVWALFMQIDILLIGAILTASAAGVFQAPVRLLSVVSYPGVALGAAIGPRLARVSADSRPDASPLVRAARQLLVVQTLMAALLVGWATPLAGAVLGGGYARSAHVLAALGPYVVLSGLAPLLSNGIDYVGGTRRRVVVGVAAVVVNAGLDAVLLPWIGVVGAAVGTDVAYALYVAGHVRVARDLLGVRSVEIAATLARCLGAGACTTVLLLLLDRAGIAGLVAGAVVAPLVYLGALVPAGEAELVTSLVSPLRWALASGVRTLRTPSST